MHRFAWTKIDPAHGRRASVTRRPRAGRLAGAGRPASYRADQQHRPAAPTSPVLSLSDLSPDIATTTSTNPKRPEQSLTSPAHDHDRPAVTPDTSRTTVSCRREQRPALLASSHQGASRTPWAANCLAGTKAGLAAARSKRPRIRHERDRRRRAPARAGDRPRRRAEEGGADVSQETSAVTGAGLDDGRRGGWRVGRMRSCVAHGRTSAGRVHRPRVGN